MCLMCRMHLVKLTNANIILHIYATRHNHAMGQSRVRRQPCLDKLTPEVNWSLKTAILAVNITEANARNWCLANHFCTGYTVEDNIVWYSTIVKSQRDLQYKKGSTVYVIKIRCPIHHQRCIDKTCKNGGTCINLNAISTNGVECVCGAYWTGWYCERRKSCADRPCLAGAMCHNSSTLGFTCTCPPFTTGITCDVQITTSTAPSTAPSTTASNTTVVVGLSTEKKVAIGAAAAGGVVLTGVAAAAVVSATSSAAGATGASAAAGGGGQ